MKVLSFPKDSNPYQELLYTELRKQGDLVDYLSGLTPSATFNLLTFLPRVFIRRLRGYNVFHLHWVNGFFPQTRIWRTKPFRILAYRHYILCLRTIKSLGYKFVWTAHNALPHEPISLDDVSMRRKLIEVTDLVIAHSPATIEALESMRMKLQHFVIIPHGSYIDSYPNTITKDAARTVLGLKPDEFVYLYLGHIRQYKGIKELLGAYEVIKNTGNKLIIAGECRDLDLKNLLQQVRSPNILLREEYIGESDLQTYFNATDVVVLPFKKITTSGSALLALSFGRAVIVPSLGDLAHLPDTVAYKYVPDDETGLSKTMEAVERNPNELKRKSEAAKSYAMELNWVSIAHQTHNAIQELFVSSK